MSEKSALAGRHAGEKTCPLCQARFTCGMAAGSEPCWCASLPPQPIDPQVTGCLCPDCLKARAQTAPVYSPRAG